MSTLATVVHVVPKSVIGGGTTYLQKLLGAFPSGYSHIVAVGSIEDKIEFPNAQLQLLANRHLKDIVKALTFLRQFDRNSTILHIHGRRGFFVFLAAKVMRFHTIVQFHGYYALLAPKLRMNRLQRFLDAILLKGADKVIFTSDGEQERIVEHYKSIAAFDVVYNRALNLPYLNTSDDPGGLDKKPRLVCLGASNSYQKGFDRMLALLSELHANGTNVELLHFHNIENENEHKNLLSLAEQLGVTKLYNKVGTTENVWNELNPKRDFVLSCSRFEGRNLVIQEAFHLGFPVIATNCIGQCELLDSERAYVLNDEDFSSWSTTVSNALKSSKENKSAKISNAHNWILQFGGVRELAEDIEKIYRAVLLNQT